MAESGRPKNACEYSYMMSDIGQVKNAAEIIAGEKDKSELGVTALDDTTLQVELNVPVSYFLSLMYFPTFYPVNEEFYNTCADTFASSPETTLAMVRLCWILMNRQQPQYI